MIIDETSTDFDLMAGLSGRGENFEGKNMAGLGTCRTCNGVVAYGANACPHCGQKDPASKPITKRPFAMIVLSVFAMLVVVVLLGIIGGRGEVPSAESAAQLVIVPAKVDVAEPSPPPSTAALAAQFKAERPAMMAAMQKALRAKDYYSSLGYGNDFKSVADPEFDALWKRVIAAEEKEMALAPQKLAAQEKAEARKKGVSIGMTREQVKASSWGRPTRVNTTTSAYGDREQWVYGSRNYLYFENGILTTIQN